MKPSTALNAIFEVGVSAMIGIFLASLCTQIRPATAAAAASDATRPAFISKYSRGIPARGMHSATSASNRQQYAPSLTLCASSSDDNEEESDDEPAGASSINVLGTKMECCCSNVGGTGIGTGFYRNGYCSTGAQDIGRHTVCVKLTDKFLEFSKAVGNDLSTPVPEYMFPGLSEGDVWCLCAQRWHQAWEASPDVAPKLYLRATHEKTLDYVPFEVLRMYALDGEEADKEREGLDEQRAQLEKLLGKEAEEQE